MQELFFQLIGWLGVRLGVGLRALCYIKTVSFNSKFLSFKKTRTNLIVKMSHFYEEKTKGVIIRARARWHEHGERSSKFFFLI